MLLLPLEMHSQTTLSKDRITHWLSSFKGIRRKSPNGQETEGDLKVKKLKKSVTCHSGADQSFLSASSKSRIFLISDGEGTVQSQVFFLILKLSLW